MSPNIPDIERNGCQVSELLNITVYLLKFKLKVKGTYQVVKLPRVLKKILLRLIGGWNTK